MHRSGLLHREFQATFQILARYPSFRWQRCYALQVSVVIRIPINHRKLRICTKKKPKRTDATALVWTKHTCTSDCIMRATRTVIASASTKALDTFPTYSPKTIAPKTGRFSMQFACARIARRYQSAPSIRSARKLRIGTRPVRIRLQRYTPTVASNSKTVHAANPTSIHTGTVTMSPHHVMHNVKMTGARGKVRPKGANAIGRPCRLPCCT
jgi:hypothetical protein